MKKLFILLIIVLLAGYFYVTQMNNEASESNETENASADMVESMSTSSEMVAYYGETQGYLARPEGDGPFPTLVLIHEWWGLNDNIKDLADDFASQGYVALAVDLYNGAPAATTSTQAQELAGGVRENVDGAFANLTAATEYLDGLAYADADRLASVGWCFGGQWAYEMAKNNIGVDATVMYYGRFMPEDDLSMMRADILGHFGEEDTTIAVDTVREFEAKLDTLEGDHAIYIYPNAGHAFANEDNEEAYNEEAAEQAWGRTMEFLSRELR